MQISYLDILARYCLFQFLFLHKNQNIPFLYPNQNGLLYEIDSLSQKKQKKTKKQKNKKQKKQKINEGKKLGMLSISWDLNHAFLKYEQIHLNS